MVVHAAFGGSTNLLLHIPAIAYHAGLRRPTVEDWIDVNRRVPRLVDALPNGPVGHPTVRVFLAGGVPEVMLHLRAPGPARRRLPDRHRRAARPACSTGGKQSERRARLREVLQQQDGIDPDDVIMSPEQARAARPDLHGDVPARQPGPGGLGHQEHGHRPERGRCRRRLSQDRPGARLHQREGRHRRHQEPRSRPHPARRRAGAHLPRADGRGHGGDVSDHLGAEASELRQAGGGAHRRPLLRRLDRGVHRPRRPRGAGGRSDRQGARRRPDSDRHRPQPAGGQHRSGRRGRASCSAPEEGARVLARASAAAGPGPDPDLPADTRLWAALQRVSGGTWGGCVYDVEAILKALS